MNLADLADHICETVRKTDSDSIAACKNYLKRRDQMLWDGYLWRDSIYQFTKVVGPDAPSDDCLTVETAARIGLLNAEGYVFLPSVVGRVMAVRLTEYVLRNEPMEKYFQQSLDQFDEEGTPVEYTLLEPAAWQSYNTQLLWLTSTDASDTGVCVVNFIDTFGGAKTVAVTLNGPGVLGGYIGSGTTIISISKPTTVGVVALRIGTVDGVIVHALAAGDTFAPQFQRLRLFPAPAEANVTIRCLVKKRYVPIVGDYEEPRLRQAENVLLAFAMGDMCRRQRQFAKADNCFAEGKALLATLANIEFHQQANRQRLVPACEPDPLRDRGYTGAFSGKGYW